MKSSKIVDVVIIVAVVFVAYFAIFKKDAPYFEDQQTIERIERVNHDTTITINVIKERLKKIDLSAFNNKIDSLVSERLKTLDKDTIIIIQDSIIYIQAESIDTLNHIVKSKDSIIGGQDFVIESKGTIIDIQKEVIKKKDRKIIKLALATVVASAISILK